MQSLDAFAAEALAGLDARALRRRLAPTERVGGAAVRRGGRDLIAFCANDYLGLAADPRVCGAAAEAALAHGAGAGASRLVSGDHPLAHALEAEIAAWVGAESALVFGSGFLANIAVPPALVGPGDGVFLDELSHACMVSGARLSGAAVHRFRHNDPEHLRVLLEREGPYRRRLVMSERVFSMDGDLAPVGRLGELCERHDAWLLMDDAHGLGVLEPAPPAPIEVGTLSKALGGYGGYVAASAPVVALLTSRARSFVYTTGLPPSVLAGAREALRILAGEPERRARPLLLARRFAAAVGLPRAESAIVPLVVGDPVRALRLSEALEAEGFLVVAIRPPTVPEGTARLRFAFSAAHADEDVERLADAVARSLESLA